MGRSEIMTTGKHAKTHWTRRDQRIRDRLADENTPDATKAAIIAAGLAEVRAARLASHIGYREDRRGEYEIPQFTSSYVNGWVQWESV